MFRYIIVPMVGQEPQNPRIKVENLKFDGVPVRLYRAVSNERNFRTPAILFIHGGGWSFLNLDNYDGVCQNFALELGALVVSVDFRLLPEHSYPVPLDDCFVALRHLMLNAHSLNIDPSRIAVAGDTTGGHLAAALSLRWRRELEGPAAIGLRPIRMLVLVYPLLQLVNSSTTSHLAQQDLVHRRISMCRATRLLAFPERSRDLPLLRALCVSNHTTRATRERLEPFFHFGPVDGSEDEVDSIVTSAQRELASSLRAAEDDAEGDPRLEAELLERLLDPEVSPLLVASFDGWPNTYVASCEFDPTRDDGLLFVRRMRRSGAAARVAHKHYPHYMLGFMLMMREPVVQRDLAAFLQQNPDFF